MERHRTIRMAWIGFAWIGLACTCSSISSVLPTIASGLPSVAAGNSGGNAGGTSGTPVPYQTPDPVTVHPTLDTAHAVSNKIEAAAGVARDGSIYKPLSGGGDFTLTIPGAMLSRDSDGSQIPAFGTAVTVTPISAIDGLPFSKGYLLAFQIGPEGILLAAPGRLTMNIPGDFNAEELVGFAADAAGTNFHLYPIQSYSVNGTTNITIGLSHYSLYGVAQATQAEITAQQAHPPQNANDQDDELLAAPLSKIQQNLAIVHDRSVKPFIDKLDNLAGDCSDVTATAFRFERWYVQVLNPSAQNALKDRIDRDANVLSERLKECLKVTCKSCLENKKADKKSANTFIVQATWLQSVDLVLDKMDDYNMWSQLINTCAANAGLPLPAPPVAACDGANCGPTVTKVTCP